MSMDDKNNKKKKENSKTVLITPFVMLLSTAIMAVYTFFQRYSFEKWLVIVLFTLVIFFAIGAFIQRIVEHYADVNIKKKKEEEKAQQKENEAVQDEENKNKDNSDKDNNSQKLGTVIKKNKIPAANETVKQGKK